MEVLKSKQGRFEGIAFVELPPKIVQVNCPICLQVLYQPHQVVCCGKSFCKECIERVKQERKSCPTCKAESYKVFQNNGLQQSLHQLQVYCTHHKEGCEWKGELGDLAEHLNVSQSAEDGCKFSVISCKFEHVGCKVILPRKDMQEHCNASMSTHISLLASSHTKLLLMLERMNERQQQVSRIGTPTSTSVEFAMRDFKRRKKDRSIWYSPPFYTHPQGYKMCLRVDPNGNGEGKGTHVSVFVCLLKGEFDDYLKWPFRGSVSIQLQSHKGEQYNHGDVIRFSDKTPDTNAGRLRKEGRGGAWGRQRFVHHDEVFEAFLKDDCLHFQITKVELKM